MSSHSKYSTFSLSDIIKEDESLPTTPTNKINELSFQNKTATSTPQHLPVKQRHLWRAHKKGLKSIQWDSGVGASESFEDDINEQQNNRTSYSNPFKIKDQLCMKRSNSSISFDDIKPLVPHKKFRERNTSSSLVEFEYIKNLGCGSFGSVTKCFNKLDGCIYAVKQYLITLAGPAHEKQAQNEIYALAALRTHPHIVRYFSSWMENDHILIQTEYCEGGSLHDVLDKFGPLRESEIRSLLLHMASALAHLHSYMLAHLDVKPENIFLCDRSSNPTQFEVRPGPFIYKLGDLGHVTHKNATDVEEGDCRYMAKELLQDNFTQLFKADIFALGLTAYEAGGGGPLPKNGDKWHQLRSGKAPNLRNISKQLNRLIQCMISPDPLARPSTSCVRRHPVLSGRMGMPKKLLERQLALAQYQNKVLNRKLRQASQCLNVSGRAKSTDSS